MDRRDLLKSCVAAVTGAAGVPVVASVVEEPTTRPVLAVFETPASLSSQTCERIAHYWQTAIADTPLEGVKAVVLQEGLTLTMLDAEGRPLNKSL